MLNMYVHVMRRRIMIDYCLIEAELLLIIMILFYVFTSSNIFSKQVCMYAFVTKADQSFFEDNNTSIT
jgi:hypothetical protein